VRSMIFMRSDLASDSWDILDIDHSDITAISIKCTFGRVRVFNIYNNGHNNSTLVSLKTFLKAFPRVTTHTNKSMDIILGDMNRHHPLWDEARNEHLFSERALKLAEMLTHLITKQDWAMALPHGMPTLEAFNSKNLTRPDNVFCSSDCIDRFILCEARPNERPPRTDHFPIFSTLDLMPETNEPEPKPDFRKVDWLKFRKSLSAGLDAIGLPGEVSSIDEFDQRLEILDNIILQTTEQEVPML